MTVAFQDDAWVFPDERELRSEYRLTGRVIVEIEVRGADPQSGEVAEYMRGTSHDVSGNGLSVSAPQPLPEGALVPLHMTTDTGGQTFTLMSEVKRSRPPDEDGHYRIGFQFIESDDTSIIEWKEAMARWLS
ncbi:MAG: PilZ domain-containing protein [Gammaproteobacteria bacterium]|nr:PilZ domain-containing protein [Gammaproteobacteria bacterium]